MSPQLLTLTSLLLLFGLLIESASGGIKTLYCAKNGFIDTEKINVVFTINNKTSKVTSNMTCEYSTLFEGKSNYRFFTQILSADVIPDHSWLEIRDGKEYVPFLRESTPDWKHRVFVSRTDRVHIVFTTLFYPTKSNNTGYQIRLTPFSIKDCPPNWTRLGTYCFSKSSAIFMQNPESDLVANAKVDFDTAQYVCNRMRANLLVASPTVLKASGVKDVGELMLKLGFRDPVWIGLMDYTDAGEGKLYWLDRSYVATELQNDWLSCHSDELKIPGGCEPTERFAYLRPTRSGFLVFDRREHLHQFACYAPVGMTDDFFPTTPSTTTTAFSVFTVPVVSISPASKPSPPTMGLLGLLLSGIILLLICILFVACLLQCRSSHRYRPVSREGDVPNILNEGHNEVNPRDYRDDGNRENNFSDSSSQRGSNNQSIPPNEPPLINGDNFSADSQQQQQQAT